MKRKEGTCVRSDFSFLNVAFNDGTSWFAGSEGGFQVSHFIKALITNLLFLSCSRDV